MEGLFSFEDLGGSSPPRPGQRYLLGEGVNDDALEPLETGFGGMEDIIGGVEVNH
jgi:hypothetical protein